MWMKPPVLFHWSLMVLDHSLGFSNRWCSSLEEFLLFLSGNKWNGFVVALGRGAMFPPASNKLSGTIQIHTLCIPFQIWGLLPCGLWGSCELIQVGWLPMGWWCCIFALLQNSFQRPLGYWRFAFGNPKHSPNLRSKSLNYSEKKQVRYRCCRSCVLDKGSEKHLSVWWLEWLSWTDHVHIHFAGLFFLFLFSISLHAPWIMSELPDSFWLGH